MGGGTYPKCPSQYSLRYGLKIGGMSVSSGPVEKDGRSSKSTVNSAEASLHDEAAAVAVGATVVEAEVSLPEETLIEVANGVDRVEKIADNSDAMFDVETLGLGTKPG